MYNGQNLIRLDYREDMSVRIGQLDPQWRPALFYNENNKILSFLLL
jgi:hypothetical protein